MSAAIAHLSVRHFLARYAHLFSIVLAAPQTHEAIGSEPVSKDGTLHAENGIRRRGKKGPSAWRAI